VALLLRGYECQRLVDYKCLGIVNDDIGNHPWPFCKLDDRDIIGRSSLERGMKRAVEHHPADQLGFA
jgi:hypothetical protein